MLDIRKEMDEIKEKFEKLHIDVVDTLFEDESPINYNHPGLFYLAKSINAMGNVDAVYFTEGWQLSRGCNIERSVAKAYGVKILDYDFLEEPKEELVRTPNKTRAEIGLPKIQLCDNLVVGKHKDGEFDMTTWYEDKEEINE